jgi:hypothetical protein
MSIDGLFMICEPLHLLSLSSNFLVVLIFLFLFFADTNYISLLASGPYGLTFASFVPFFLDIPVTSQFRIFGLSFSNKSFIYLVGLQVSLLPYSIFVIYLFILSDHIVSFSPCSFFYLLGSVPLFLVYLVWLLVLFIV